ncbi:MAG: hypothetical protein HC769_24490 [Cyanobacteria bacterium CRU_2_1]|nr:hypothetical protein [Cyanobacteria bacterium CRU_2_1]
MRTNHPTLHLHRSGGRSCWTHASNRAARGIAIDTHRLELGQVERAIIDGEADGFIALYTQKGIIVGATFVAAHAGESLPLLTLAIMQKMTPADLASVIHCYPTQVEVIQRVAALAS